MKIAINGVAVCATLLLFVSSYPARSQECRESKSKIFDVNLENTLRCKSADRTIDFYVSFLGNTIRTQEGTKSTSYNMFTFENGNENGTQVLTAIYYEAPEWQPGKPAYLLKYRGKKGQSCGEMRTGSIKSPLEDMHSVDEKSLTTKLICSILKP